MGDNSKPIEDSFAGMKARTNLSPVEAYQRGVAEAATLAARGQTERCVFVGIIETKFGPRRIYRKVKPRSTLVSGCN